jgi:KDO2-lipid IV(A) lauroyltransferase
MSSNNKFTRIERILANIIFYSCKIVGSLPFWFLYYVLADIIYFFFYVVGRYRVKVVRANLVTSFPEKSKAELRTIEERFYHNLSEYFVDAIEMAAITPKKWAKRVVYFNADQTAQEIAGRDWIDLLAHYGSWELFGSFVFHQGMGSCMAAYHPLKNRAFDLYYIKVRNRFEGLGAVPMKELLRFYVTHHKEGWRGKRMSLCLIADQNAPADAQSEWVPFLNHPTVFFHGGEKIARKFGLPVYYMHVHKPRRGRYEAWFEQVWDGTSPTEPHAITRRYAALLEADIRECPELWLWSHRRWKKRLKGAELQEFNQKWGTDIPDKGIYHDYD